MRDVGLKADVCLQVNGTEIVSAISFMRVGNRARDNPKQQAERHEPIKH